MKNVKITREEYEGAIYPAVALNRPKNTEAIQRSLAVKGKLEDLGVRKPTADSWKDSGLPSMYAMVEDEAVLLLEDAESDWLRAAITEGIENQMFVTEKAGLALAFRDRLEKAATEKIGADGVSEERKAAVEAGD